ncbi:MAG: hypothetical protein ACKO1F_02500 [Flammeovirgaceae bacterium]
MGIPKSFKIGLLALLLMAVANLTFGQNTKGDKPARALPKQIQKSKPKKEKVVKSNTRDISGRRLRTKNKSSAVLAIEQPPATYYRKKRKGDKPGRPVSPRRIQSSTARAARNNVYPNSGPYVNNNSRKPRSGERSFSKAPYRNATPQVVSRSGERVFSPPRKNRSAPRSASRSFVTRGKKNVYWGKFRKGEKPYTKDIAGRELRTRNFKSPPLLFEAGPRPYKPKKLKGRDRPYQGTFKSGYASATKRGERAWRGDVSGRSLRRTSSGRKTENPGQFIFPRKFSVSGNRGRANGPLPGGSINGRRWNNNGNSIGAKVPPGFAARTGNYTGNIRLKNAKHTFRDQGEEFTGFTRSIRQLKGGGSISAKRWNNNGNSIGVKVPPGSAARTGNYTGNIRLKNAKHTFRDQGEEFTGFTKTKRPLKGGGSISGQPQNNNGNPLSVRPPSASARGGGTYSGNIRIQNAYPRMRDQGEEFTGFIKSRKPKKGGGSVSGKLWNNKEKPIASRAPLARDVKITNYSGKIKMEYGYIKNLRASKLALKKKEPASTILAEKDLILPVKRDYLFVQNPKANKNSLKKRKPNDDTFAAEGLQVKVKRDYKYVQNPKANKNSLKKKEPDDDVFAVEGLQIKVKQGKYIKKPNAKDGMLKGIGPSSASVKASEYEGRMKILWSYKHNPSSNKSALDVRKPNQTFSKGNTFQGRARLTRNYRHNPKSDKDALKVIAPGRAYAKINNYQGNLKMSKPGGKGLHPDAKFAHGHRDNVKGERTIFMNVKLWWAKLFKKSDNQTEAVKEKVRRPRYDKKEKELWKDLYD